MKKLIVILGPTASGKTEMAVKIALRFDSRQAKKKFGISGAEIVSADSRQVYRKMNIGTAKPIPDTKNSSNFSTGQAKKKYIFTHKGIPHHLISLISPNKIFTVSQYRKLALKTIKDIQKGRRIPILCGGTGFYIQAIIDGIIIPRVKPDWKLREKLEKKSAEELFNELEELDLKRAETIDKKNKRRLIRALEIVIKTKKPVPLAGKKPFPYPVLMLGIKKTKQELEKRIINRVNQMFQSGLEKEVKFLVKKYGWVPALQTIGYREWEQYFTPLDSKHLTRFEEKVNKDGVKELIILHTKQFVRRQMVWFKKDERIKWIKKQPEAEKLAKEFLGKKLV